MPQIFPRKANAYPLLSLGVLGVGALVVVFAAWYWMSPEFLEVGYEPQQPVPYSHALHVGQLGIDCRYCHNHVEQSPHANVPATQTCMNCHNQIQTGSLALLPVRESWATGDPIQWVKVHQLPDYAHFSHAAHVNVGVGCESCHGRVDQMEVVYTVANLSMGWCLDCHRDPSEHLRPPSEVTTMGYLDAQLRPGEDGYRERRRAFTATNEARIQAENIRPPQNCSACHY
ncbi:cytochrome c3 family protein [soil metagenome]